MKTEQADNRVGSAFLVFSLLFGIAIVLITPARAQKQDYRAHVPATANSTAAASVTQDDGYADGHAGY